MAQEAEAPKRRGRPRLNDDERKRHTMTFRMRDDLRAAVEELAQANGRSLSEQIEYYVEASVRSEAALIYQYSTDAMSPVLFKAITGRDSGADGPGLDVNFPVGHREMLTIAGQTCLNQPAKPAVKVSWPADFGEVRTLLCDAAREGAEQALARYALVQPGTKQARPKSGKEEPSAPHNPLSVEGIEAEFARVLGRAVLHSAPASDADPASIGEQASLLERLRFLVGPHTAEQAGQPAKRHPRMPMPADMPPDGPYAGKDLSIAALRDLVAQFRGGEPDLEALRAAGWPALFNLLPTATRTALIRDLRERASDVYLALMSPGSPRNEAVTALRRLQAALLPRDEGDEGPHNGPDDFDDIEPLTGRARR
jgi:hypothetical protein